MPSKLMSGPPLQLALGADGASVWCWVAGWGAATLPELADAGVVVSSIGFATLRLGESPTTVDSTGLAGAGRFVAWKWRSNYSISMCKQSFAIIVSNEYVLLI